MKLIAFVILKTAVLGMRERGGCRVLVRVLQFLPRTQIASLHTSDGSGSHGSRLDGCGIVSLRVRSETDHMRKGSTLLCRRAERTNRFG